MQFELTRMYQVRAVAEHFGVSVATIYRAIGSGQLAALKLGTGKGAIRVPGSAVAEYSEACAQAAREQHEVTSRKDETSALGGGR
ncbi:helix-turn-helix transcriptional regulator [Pseudonocardia sp. Cha107L01]|uniref:helix-turn-helix transcriptional regulator n=1 Tax=Pseudonocardia sp. Cha107L01 TaxID=3457576 RepID=UPI00403EAE3D